MSPNSLRVLAGAAAAVLALITAIVVGLVSRSTPAGCPPDAATVVPPAATAPATPTAAPTPTARSGFDTGNSPTPDNAAGGLASGAAGGQAQAQAEARAKAEAALAACEPKTFSPLPAVAALLGAGVTGLVALVLLIVAGRSVRTPGPVAPVSGVPAIPRGNGHTTQRTSDSGGGRTEADRAALVRACIYVRDRVTSRALADRLNAALADAGVTSVEPVGDRFDPARHEAGGTTPAKDPAQTGTIAAVEVPGYVDRTGRVLRPPIVTVYQAAGGRSTDKRGNEEDR